MENKINKYIIIGLIIITSGSVYMNYKVWNSFVIQGPVTSDFNKRIYQSENLVKLENLDLNFPNLSATTFPLNGFLAKYYLASKEYDKAFKLLNKENRVNPYLFLMESLKSEAYRDLGMRDSAYYYSKIAYENLPGNARHFEQYISELTHKKDVQTIKKIFRESEFKFDEQFWRLYFSSVIKIKDENDTEIDSFAKIALQKFPDNDKIKIISSFILHGEENIKKSYVLVDQGQKEFALHKYKKASKKFIEAFKLNPEDYTIIENIGMSLTKNEEYQEAIKYFKIVIDEKNIKDGKSNFGLATCYEGLNDRKKACENLLISMEYNYNPSFALYSKICKQ